MTAHEKEVAELQENYKTETPADGTKGKPAAAGKGVVKDKEQGKEGRQGKGGGR